MQNLRNLLFIVVQNAELPSILAVKLSLGTSATKHQLRLLTLRGKPSFEPASALPGEIHAPYICWSLSFAGSSCRIPILGSPKQLIS